MPDTTAGTSAGTSHGTFEARMGHVGARIDDARVEGEIRVHRLVDRIDEALESLHAKLDDLKVQAALGKAEVAEFTDPVVEDLRNRSLEARVALGQLRGELTQAKIDRQ